MLRIIRLKPRERVKWRDARFSLHRGVGTCDFFFQLLGGIRQKNSQPDEDQEKANPNGPVIFRPPQITPWRWISSNTGGLAWIVFRRHCDPQYDSN